MRELLRLSINEACRKVPGRAQPDANSVLADVEVLRRTMADDTRLTIHEDDFIQLLTWYLKPHVWGTAFHQADVVRPALMSCLESTNLAQYPMFAAEILKRTAA